jgi:hypothetical protein
MDANLYDKLLDVEQDMDFMKTTFLASFADRMLNVESAIDCIDKKVNIFLPDREELTESESAYFGKFNTRLSKHSKEISKIKQQLGEPNG